MASDIWLRTIHIAAATTRATLSYFFGGRRVWLFVCLCLYWCCFFCFFVSLCVTFKSTSTEGIQTMDLQFECPSALPTELIVKFPLATASRSSLHQHCYMCMCVLLFTVSIIKCITNSKTGAINCTTTGLGHYELDSAVSYLTECYLWYGML